MIMETTRSPKKSFWALLCKLMGEPLCHLKVLHPLLEEAKMKMKEEST